MRRKVFLILGPIMLILAGWFLLPIPMPGDHGEYNTITRLVWCDSQYACLHEQGHALDHTNGWISQTDDYGKALKFYALTNVLTGKPSALALRIIDGLFISNKRWGWNERAEIYADIYAGAGGNLARVPENLRKFYSRH